MNWCWNSVVNNYSGKRQFSPDKYDIFLILREWSEEDNVARICFTTMFISFSIIFSANAFSGLKLLLSFIKVSFDASLWISDNNPYLLVRVVHMPTSSRHTGGRTHMSLYYIRVVRQNFHRQWPFQRACRRPRTSETCRPKSISIFKNCNYICIINILNRLLVYKCVSIVKNGLPVLSELSRFNIEFYNNTKN